MRWARIRRKLIGVAVFMPLQLASMTVCRLLFCIRHLRRMRHLVVIVPVVSWVSIWLIGDRLCWVFSCASA